MLFRSHRFGECRNVSLQIIVARLVLGVSYEQPRAVGVAVDLKLQTAGLDGIARHVIIAPAGPETAPQKGITIAIDKAAPAAPGDDHRAIEAAAIKAAVPGVAEAGARYDALAALVDAIVHADDQIGAFAVRRGAIAIARQFEIGRAHV